MKVVNELPFLGYVGSKRSLFTAFKKMTLTKIQKNKDNRN